jgi:hypothetical protein
MAVGDRDVVGVALRSSPLVWWGYLFVLVFDQDPD